MNPFAVASTSLTAAEPVQGYLRSQGLPLAVWVGPHVHHHIAATLRSQLAQIGSIVDVPPAEDAPVPTGPAVLVLAAEDLTSPDRDALLRLAHLARPGRPIVCGGWREREVLLDAINTWHAIRLLPDAAPEAALVDAIGKAYEAMQVEAGLTRGAVELREECGRLSAALAELQATQERLLHGERLTAIGRMTGILLARVQHHLHSMDDLAAAMGPVDDPQLQNIAIHAVEGSRSIGSLLQDMLAVVEHRGSEVTTRPEHLDALVEQAAALFRRDHLAHNYDLQLSCRSAAVVEADRYRIYHVILNLLRNAAQASPIGSQIELSTSIDHDTAIIEVEDHGCGMSEETLQRIFHPFYTTKGQGGTGLGLRMSKAAIERQGGTIDCKSQIGTGTCFRIRLPLAQTSSR